MDTFNYIREKLEMYRSSGPDENRKTLALVPEQFIFYYGPFMCMETGFEQEVDEMASIPSMEVIKLMQYAAFLLRGIRSLSYGDTKKFIRDFIGEVDAKHTFINKEWSTALQNMGIQMLTRVREVQKEDGSLESAMINYAPIVTYSQEISKQYNGDEPPMELDEEFKLIAEEAQRLTGTSSDRLKELLVTDLQTIMCNYHLAEASVDPINIMDGYNIDEEYPLAARLYYSEALEYMMGVSEIHHKQYYDSLKKMIDFAHTKDYGAFEAMLTSVIQTYKEMYKDKEELFDAILEVWEDPSLTDHENEVVNQMLQDHTVSESAPNDLNDGILNKFLNFIALRRHVQFDEFARRKFVESLEKTRIVNFTSIRGGIGTLYELDNGAFALPYLDARDYMYHFALYKDSMDSITVYVLAPLSIENCGL